MVGGANYFDLSDWQSGSGGTWENWYVNNGVFMTASTTNPNCNDVLDLEEVGIDNLRVSPNPFIDFIRLSLDFDGVEIRMYDVLGKQVEIALSGDYIDASSLHGGIYFLQVTKGDAVETFKLVKN
ncbi:MAG: hypothetical protein Wins2KO_00130 [Winogradskyella sp.]